MDDSPTNLPPLCPEDDGLIGWIIAYGDGRIKPEDLRQLEMRLLTDGRARDLFTAMSIDQLLLHQIVNEERVQDDMEELDKQIVAELVEKALADREQHLFDEQSSKLQPVNAQTRINRRSPFVHTPSETSNTRVIVIPRAVVWFASVAAIVLVAAMIYAFLPSRSIAPTPVVTAPEIPTVAQITDTHIAVWEATSDTPSGELRLGTRLRLVSGLAEIRFKDNAKVIVEGPATFTLTGTREMRLSEGRLTANIVDSSHGFEVATPQGVVTDLGTEFGVILDPSGVETVQVYSGSVRAQAGYEPDAPTLVLNSSKAASIAASTGIQPIAFDYSASLVRDLDTARRRPRVSEDVAWLTAAPEDLRRGNLESSKHAYLLLENIGVEIPSQQAHCIAVPGRYLCNDKLPSQLPLHRLPAGRYDTYFMHFDAQRVPTSDRATVTGEVTFNHPIAAIVFAKSELSELNGLVGRPQIVYPAEHAGDDYFGLDDPAPESNADILVLSEDRRTLQFTLNAGQEIDQLRIFTEHHE